MSTEEEYKELSAKLRYGLELAEQRLIEETARREGTLCYGRPDGKVVRISAKEKTVEHGEVDVRGVQH